MELSAHIRWMALIWGVLFLWGCDTHKGDTVTNVNGQPNLEESAAEQTRPATQLSATPPAKPPAKQPQHKHTNRLARETSPYLLLHAHNPVDWFPWGPEAFEKAKREGKPIFLSIGYSSCYWCHVMERLVFQNEQIAKYMNEHFVSIKVDREERPDVDDIYMTSLIVYFQAIGSPQGGGWPLSMFLTPGGKPFAGGTYFPPDDQHGRPGFATVLKRVAELWKEQRKQVEANAGRLTQQVRRAMKPQSVVEPVKIERQLVTETAKTLIASHDAEYGGIDFNPRNPNAPKFPVPAKLALLQYQISKHGDKDAGKVVYHTLDRLAAGGIYDHLGDGFHRYSTDRFWHVPHFEKMLYDQAQLADVYAEAYRRTKKALYREVAEGILTHVLRDMTAPRGGFYSAIDAETGGVEGEYYVWSEKEVEKLLGGDAKLFKRTYGMQEPQVFEHGYVLHLPRHIEDLAAEMKVSPDELKRQLAGLRKTLLTARGTREAPLRDDKILTSWNGLMIRAFAHVGAALGRGDYVRTAEQAARFILKEMRDDQGRLYHTYRAGQAKLNAYLDDYAFLIEGLLAIYQATGNDEWKNAARRLTDEEIELFWDDEGKGFFFTPHDHEELIARTKNAYDAVLPSGNSVSVRNLIRIASHFGEDKYRQHAREVLELYAAPMKQTSGGMCNMALAMGEYLDQPDFSSVGSSTSKEVTPKETRPVPATGIQPIAAQTSPKKKEDDRVTAKAYLSVDKLPAGGTCRIVLLLNIKAGWHINTNPAHPDFLVPTTFTMTSKQGTKLLKPQYPEGKKLTVAGFDEPLHVYETRVVIYGAVEVPRSAAGKTEDVQLTVRYQACNNSRCLKPATLTLTGRLPVARPSEPVKQINQNLFPQPKKQ